MTRSEVEPVPSTERLSHFSREPYLRKIYSKPQTCEDYRSCYDKPDGLWVSVDGEDDWESWCRAESFGIGPYRHVVHLTDGANILRISNACDLMCFRERYGRPGRYPRDIYIPWEIVAQDYQGIIIAPYQWSCRMEERWYYGWDCASGCIWDAAAIYCVEPVREVA